MLDEALERLVRRATEADAGRDLAEARESFHARTGVFEPSDPWYEPRIRFFLDWYLCRWISRDGTRPADRAAESDLDRAVAHACAAAARSVYRVLDGEETQLRVADLLGRGRFRIAHAPSDRADRLRSGDVFDGHLVVLEDRILLAPGRLFHPPETHAPMHEILTRARMEATLDRVELLDGLLRMRMRLDRFTSMRARHVYRWEALHDHDILSAAWARRVPGDG